MRFTAEALTKEQIFDIHSLTLDLLENTGIAMHHEPSRKIFAENGADVQGEIVKIPGTLAAKMLKGLPKSFTVVGRNLQHSIKIGAGNDPVWGPAAGPVFVTDSHKNRHPGTIEDLKNFLALSQSSPYIGVACPGILSPADIAPQEKHLQAMMEAIRISDKPLVGLALGKKVSDDCIRMARIAAGDLGDYYIIGIVNSLSPMAWDERMLEAVWSYAGKGQPLILTCCSMAGFTSPTTLASTLVQNNAEVLSGMILCQLINPGTPVVYGNTSTITDMLTMNLCIGAPEYALLSTACAQLARFYGVPFRSGGGLSDAKELDPQAGIESTTNLLFTMANQVDFVLHALGVMESFLSISYEKWIMDEEILGRIYRLRRGIGELPQNAGALISEVGSGGHYLDQPDTMLNFRDVFHQPLISDRGNWDSWLAKEKTYAQKAAAACQKRLENFNPPQLPLSMESELKLCIDDCLKY
ncbi:MAG: trimethylamine methyltransferase family protein [Dehalobacterium sp.]